MTVAQNKTNVTHLLHMLLPPCFKAHLQPVLHTSLKTCFPANIAVAPGCSWVASADHEGEHGLASVGWPWSHEGMTESYDHAAIRRGFQVYQQVRHRSS
jgi:cytochrome c1